MKTFKFKITETWFGGTKIRFMEVKARHEKSALKKVIEIQGNRDWFIEALGEAK